MSSQNIPAPTPSALKPSPSLPELPPEIQKAASDAKAGVAAQLLEPVRDNRHGPGIGRPAGDLSVQKSFHNATVAGAARGPRDTSALFTAPSVAEDVVRQRVNGARALIASLIAAADRDIARSLTMIDEITKHNGGEELAAKEGLHCAAAKEFLTKLDALIDSAAPKK